MDAAEKTGTMNVMQDKNELAQIQKQKEMTAQISVPHTPQFWTYTSSQYREWSAIGGEDKKNEGGKERNDKMNDIGPCNGSDCKLSHCTICNKNDVVSDSNNVNDRAMGKMNDSTEQKELMDKKEERGNGTVGEKKNDMGKRMTLTRVQGKPILQKKNDLQRKRQLLSAKQLKKLLKKKEPVFLALVRLVGSGT